MYHWYIQQTPTQLAQLGAHKSCGFRKNFSGPARSASILMRPEVCGLALAGTVVVADWRTRRCPLCRTKMAIASKRDGSLWGYPNSGWFIMEHPKIPCREFFLHFHPPPSETGITVWTCFCKIKRLPKEMGGAPHTFSVFGFKSLFRKRWGGGFIHWFCKAIDLWCSWSFPGESYEIAWRFWGPSPWNLSLPNYGRPPTPMG